MLLISFQLHYYNINVDLLFRRKCDKWGSRIEVLQYAITITIVTSDSLVLRWDAPDASFYPCFHSLSSYNVQVGSHLYNVLQQALVLDLDLFPTCIVHEVLNIKKTNNNY